MSSARAWVIIWNPKHYDWEKNGLRTRLEEYASQGYVKQAWSCGWTHSLTKSGPQEGGRFFALRVGTDRPGLMGAGRFLSRPDHRIGEWRGAPLARLRFEYLADYKDQTFVSRKTLQELTGDRMQYQASGMPMKPETAAQLELLLTQVRKSRRITMK